MQRTPKLRESSILKPFEFRDTQEQKPKLKLRALKRQSDKICRISTLKFSIGYTKVCAKPHNSEAIPKIQAL